MPTHPASPRPLETPADPPRAVSRTELIRRLGSSRFNYWFGYVANLSLVVWMVSHAFSRRYPRLGVTEFVAFAVTGLVSWTLSEFLLHRYLYHVLRTFLREGHALHHQSPRALIGVPWYLTTIAIIAIFEVLTLWLRPSSTGVVMGFNWLGYILYCVMHHGSHHWAYRRGWLKRMKRHHLIHHAHPAYNWGFTTPFWDYAFGTHYDRRARVRRDGGGDGDGDGDGDGAPPPANPAVDRPSPESRPATS